jgi:c-di-GMP-binding flagellar brake protein YcgR
MENFNTPETSDLSPYMISSPYEIMAIMRNLCERKQLLRMLIVRGEESIVTSILHIDVSDESIVLDISSDERINERILAASPLRFETVLDNISISFEVPQVEQCLFEDRPAFLMPLPVAALRLQRREFYRVETPRINPARCVIQIPNENGRTAVSLPLQNVSGGGVAILDEQNMLDPTIGTVYEDCRIELPDRTFLVVKLQIRNTRQVKLTDGRSMRRLGCLFIELPRPMLAAVQRYITKLEREQNTKNTVFE